MTDFPEKLAEENKIYIQLNDSQENHLNDTEKMLKRSTDDDDEDADDDDDANKDKDSSDDGNTDSNCPRTAKFERSVIPNRNKNYHYKRLAKKSKTLKTCSKTCCETDNCILSFLVEKRCFGVICKGDGNCHSRKEKLPKTKFQLSLVKREGLCLYNLIFSCR